MPDLRGTGASQPESDADSHRADRIAADVATLVDHLRMAPLDVLAHSAGANVAILLAERRPDLVSRLILVTPGTRVLGIGTDDAEWEASLERRAGEPWYDDVRTALEADEPTAEQELQGQALFYGRWDDRARAHAASDGPQRNVEATGWFHDGAYDPERTREGLAKLKIPVRILLGELDPWPNARARRGAGRGVPGRRGHRPSGRRTLPLGRRPRGRTPRPCCALPASRSSPARSRNFSPCAR